MALPFSFKYYRYFKRELTPEETTIALKYIDGVLRKRFAHGIKVTNNSIQYNEGFWGLRSRYLSSAERGIFTIATEAGKSTIFYEIFMYRLFIVAAVAGAFFSFFLASFWAFLPCLVIAGGANCLFTIVHNGTLLNEIKAGINKLTCIEEQDQTI